MKEIKENKQNLRLSVGAAAGPKKSVKPGADSNHILHRCPNKTGPSQMESRFEETDRKWCVGEELVGVVCLLQLILSAIHLDLN